MAFAAAALPWIMTATAVAGAGMGAMGAIQSANAQAASSRYQAQVASNNARIAQQNSEYAIQAGQRKSEQAGEQQRAILASARGNIAAHNVDVNTGSAADVQTTDRQAGYQSVSDVLNNADLTAYGYKTQATSFQAQSGLDQATASQAGTAGMYSAAGTLLGGASSLSSQWMKLLPGASNGTTPTFGT